MLALGGAEQLPAAALSDELIGMAWSEDAVAVAVQVGLLSEGFFDLRSGIIGDAAQKFANYRLLLVVVGDVDGFAQRSKALRDYVLETNAGENLWFVPDIDALKRKLDGG